MKALAIVPVRMDSRRLPGKALVEVAGRALVDHVLRRAQAIPGISGVVCATTARTADDALAAHARASGFEVYRGATEDVAARFLACARAFGSDWFVRVNGDCVLADPDLIGEGLAIAGSGRADLVTNLVERDFPYGIAVEVMATETYERIYPKMQTPEDREHVTSFIYRNPQGLSIHSMTSAHPELKAARLVVDTPEDLQRFRRIAEHLGSRLDTTDYIGAARAYFETAGEVS